MGASDVNEPHFAYADLGFIVGDLVTIRWSGGVWEVIDRYEAPSTNVWYKLNWVGGGIHQDDPPGRPIEVGGDSMHLLTEMEALALAAK